MSVGCQGLDVSEGNIAVLTGLPALTHVGVLTQKTLAAPRAVATGKRSAEMAGRHPSTNNYFGGL